LDEDGDVIPRNKSGFFKPSLCRALFRARADKNSGL
jgi:hypothetical protein